MRKELVIGDTVKIVREGLIYRQFNEWAERHGATGWNNKAEPRNDSIFKVVAMGAHSPSDQQYEYAMTILYLIEDDEGKQFIFERDGIEFITNKPYFKEEEFNV